MYYIYGCIYIYIYIYIYNNAKVTNTVKTNPKQATDNKQTYNKSKHKNKQTQKRGKQTKGQTKHSTCTVTIETPNREESMFVKNRSKIKHRNRISTSSKTQ